MSFFASFFCFSSAFYPSSVTFFSRECTSTPLYKNISSTQLKRYLFNVFLNTNDLGWRQPLKWLLLLSLEFGSQSEKQKWLSSKCPCKANMATSLSLPSLQRLSTHGQPWKSAKRVNCMTCSIHKWVSFFLALSFFFCLLISAADFDFWNGNRCTLKKAIKTQKRSIACNVRIKICWSNSQFSTFCSFSQRKFCSFVS